MGNQGPPVLLPLGLLLKAIKRAVLAEIHQVIAVLAAQQIPAAAAQGFAVGGPPLLVFLLDRGALRRC